MHLKLCNSDADINFVMSVRNDPETRKQSRRQHVLTWGEIVGASNGAQRETRIAEAEGIKIGYVHFDRLENTCELSWIIAPAHRRMGLGTQMVHEALRIVECPVVIAEIKPDNRASILIAQRCGFKKVDEHNGLEVWRCST